MKDLPVLGALFRSRDFQNNESELVVTVSAYLVNPVSPTQIARPDDGYVVPTDLETMLLGRLNAVYGGKDSKTPAHPSEEFRRLHRAMTKEAPMTHSTKILRAAAVLAALVLAACANPISKPENGAPVEERFPITVEPHMESLRVPYNAARGNLDDASSAELQSFARDYLENGSGTLSVSGTRRIPDAPNYVAGRLVAMGVPRNRIMIGSDDALSAADEVKVTYIRYQAHASGCGVWSVYLGDTSENKVSPNFRLRHSAQSSGHGRRSARSSVAQTARTGRCATPPDRARKIPQG